MHESSSHKPRNRCRCRRKQDSPGQISEFMPKRIYVRKIGSQTCKIHHDGLHDFIARVQTPLRSQKGTSEANRLVSDWLAKAWNSGQIMYSFSSDRFIQKLWWAQDRKSHHLARSVNTAMWWQLNQYMKWSTDSMSHPYNITSPPLGTECLPSPLLYCYDKPYIDRVGIRLCMAIQPVSTLTHDRITTRSIQGLWQTYYTAKYY